MAMRETAGKIERWWDQWTQGALLLFMVAISLAGGALVVGIPLLIIEAVLELGEGWAETWLKLSAIVWAPFWAGYLAVNVSKYLPARDSRLGDYRFRPQPDSPVERRH